MALTKHHATLEYATNTLEFWLFDDLEEPQDFEGSLTFNIERIDGTSIVYTVGAVQQTGNYVKFVVSPPAGLRSAEDTVYDYDHPTFDHVYSVKSASQVYVLGKLNLIKVA